MVANSPSVLEGDFIANNFTQPAALPSYELAAIDHLNATHPGTRVFAIPGNDFAAYRWGDTVDTPQPALLNRDFVTREQQVMGSIATADTLYAIDAPIQDGTDNWTRWRPWPASWAPATSWSSTTSSTSATASPSPRSWPPSCAQTPSGPDRSPVLRVAPAQRLDRLDPQRAGPEHARRAPPGPPPS